MGKQLFKYQKWLKFIGVLFFTYIVYVLFIVFTPYVTNYLNRVKFNSGTWINWKESEKDMSLRWNMVSDLKNNYKLIGKEISVIKEILGKPNYVNKNNIGYNLGMSGFGINMGVLTIITVDGKVTELLVIEE